MYKADLHCHSTCSDGTLTPVELLEHAKEKALSAISITDHDTLDAYSEDIFQKSTKLGVKLYVGVEFSTQHKNFSVHLLGYGVKKTPEILEFCQKHQERRLHRNREILEKLKRLSMIVDAEELGCPNNRTVGRPHIAELLLKKHYISSIQEAFDRYIGEGKPCFVSGENFTPQETIAIIRSAGGKAFIAHPHLIKKREMVEDLLSMDFDGIECYYSLFGKAHEEKWLNVAKEKGWLVSGGSDFHGSIKPQIQLGASWVNKKRIEAIFGEL
ncbi:MAG: PHP domain-containing protein [Simkaniaceae bacterium]|nr:PHP domain-containing protein [Simkaniaceae bacterium]